MDMESLVSPAVIGLNPCFKEFLPIETPQGIRVCKGTGHFDHSRGLPKKGNTHNPSWTMADLSRYLMKSLCLGVVFFPTIWRERATPADIGNGIDDFST